MCVESSPGLIMTLSNDHIIQCYKKQYSSQICDLFVFYRLFCTNICFHAGQRVHFETIVQYFVLNHSEWMKSWRKKLGFSVNRIQTFLRRISLLCTYNSYYYCYCDSQILCLSYILWFPNYFCYLFIVEYIHIYFAHAHTICPEECGSRPRYGIANANI